MAAVLLAWRADTPAGVMQPIESEGEWKAVETSMVSLSVHRTRDATKANTRDSKQKQKSEWNRTLPNGGIIGSPPAVYI